MFIIREDVEVPIPLEGVAPIVRVPIAVPRSRVLKGSELALRASTARAQNKRAAHSVAGAVVRPTKT